MPTYALSDLHLDDGRSPGRLYDDDEQGRALADLCARIADGPDGGELVLLGDAFDLTAMLPPERGLDDFARRTGVALDPPPRRSLMQLLADLARANPRTIDALARLSERCRVTLVPGNHDWQLAEPDAPAALAAIGLGAVEVLPFVERTFGGRPALFLHGHEFDPGNRDPNGTGAAMTACLHHAAIPYLVARGKRRNVRVEPDRIVALRPEEAVVSVMRRWLTPDDFDRFFRAFLDLLAANGYLPRALAFLAGVVPLSEVRKQIASADRVWETAADAASDRLNGRRALPGAAASAGRPDLLVLGHTHVLDWATMGDENRLYVNLGTWTDRCHDAMSPPDLSLPVLLLTLREGRRLATLTDLRSGRELQRYEASAQATASEPRRKMTPASAKPASRIQPSSSSALK